MKNAYLFIGAIVLLLAPLAGQSVKVVSPNGGESWALNSSQTITWTSGNAGNVKVDIILRRSNNTKVGVIMSQVSLAAGSWPWLSVCKLEDGTMAPAGTDYIVRIRDAANTFGDDSNAVFTISGAPPPPPPPAGPASITVISPNGGETWFNGRPHNITWNAANWTGTVRLELWQNGVDKGDIAAGIPSAPGNYPWQVGKLVSGSAGSGSGYKVRVVKEYKGMPAPMPLAQLKDESDNPFSIGIWRQGITAKPQLGSEEYTLTPTIQNCHYILFNNLDLLRHNHFDYNLWAGMPQGMANVGFLWFRSRYLKVYDGGYEKHFEAWRSWLHFNADIKNFIGKGNIKEARLTINRKWRTHIDPSIRLPGISYPCLAGIVLLNHPPPCEWGEIMAPRFTVPSPDGTAIPVVSPTGDTWVIDVTQHLQQIVKGERQDYGIMLYAGYEQDATTEVPEETDCLIVNAGCYKVSLYVRFVPDPILP